MSACFLNFLFHLKIYLDLSIFKSVKKEFFKVNHFIFEKNNL